MSIYYQFRYVACNAISMSASFTLYLRCTSSKLLPLFVRLLKKRMWTRSVIVFSTMYSMDIAGSIHTCIGTEKCMFVFIWILRRSQWKKFFSFAFDILPLLLPAPPISVALTECSYHLQTIKPKSNSNLCDVLIKSIANYNFNNNRVKRTCTKEKEKYCRNKYNLKGVCTKKKEEESWGRKRR